ncbi:DNA helicase IV [Vibrio nitrifigilis]|uniref:DNA 3'-5' helicase n=1 Tax=Vibrio nitrifigilis TaxID=2789781 RepID=A0ABS0GL19_9VIBR|nr:DNA helicase IV [Vibrio nitrifigilis]MBF9002995.1 DNA helicase IV [Vibrio nitrifigilis]
MQLSANKTAQFFISDEYHQVSLEKELIVLSSHQTEERIPYHIWNGCVRVNHGLIWGSMQFYAHEEEGVQRSWLVQGLPWPQCRDFAEYLVTDYQRWHDLQCEKLSEYLPRWREELLSIGNLPSFLPHSLTESWVTRVLSDLDSIGATIEETHQRLPEAMEPLLPWLLNTSETLYERNQAWLGDEQERWQPLFANIESSPMNNTQQQAVLLNDDHNLVLAGAGSGKTSVLTARVAYLLQSGLAHPEDILLVAFGKDAAQEMEQRIQEKVGERTQGVRVNTFHQLGLNIINRVEGGSVALSPLALDDNQRTAWCIDWLKRHWMTDTNFKRWQQHLSKWPIAYITGDDELGSHVENPKLIAWLVKQIDQLSMLNIKKKELQERIVDHEEYARLNSELNLCWPCFRDWQKMLKDEDQIDFNIMISRAAQYVQKGKFPSPWKFIMVDEYQDISPQRLELIQSLCEQKTGSCNLFAVGDDWQAIYQFAGSDVNLTTGFAARFPQSTIHHLDTTYRFNEQIANVANQFIQQNPNQLPKTLNSYKSQKQKAVYVAPSHNVEKIIDQLNRKADGLKTLLLLGRNHYHKPELLKDWQNRYLSLRIDFMTCHASKGKEANYVIILNVDEGQFPAKVKAVHLDGVLSHNNDDYPYAEERRLFYVAMTRAKEKVWITHSGQGSAFVQELVNGDYPIVKQK